MLRRCFLEMPSNWLGFCFPFSIRFPSLVVYHPRSSKALTRFFNELVFGSCCCCCWGWWWWWRGASFRHFSALNVFLYSIFTIVISNHRVVSILGLPYISHSTILLLVHPKGPEPLSSRGEDGNNGVYSFPSVSSSFVLLVPVQLFVFVYMFRFIPG